VKGDNKMFSRKAVAFIFAAVCLTTARVQDGNDASLPEYYILRGGIKSVSDLDRLTPPLINAFAAPDGAMRGLAFDGQYLWAANSGDDNSIFGPKIYRLDPDSGTVITAYNGIVDHPCGLAWDGQYLWHSTYIGGTIYQLDTFGLTIVKTFIAPTTHPFDLAWDGNHLYAVRGNEPYISVIDTSTGVEIDSIEATYTSPNVRPFGLAFLGRNAPQLLTCDGNYGSNLVNAWNFYTSSWVDQWAGEPTIYPSGLAYDSVTERLWVSCYDRDSIYVYDVSQVGIDEADIEYVHGVQLDARPNPFSKTTRIRFMIHDPRYMIEEANQNISGSEGRISNHQCPEIGIYDAKGGLVKSLYHESWIVNRESVFSWDGTDMYGEQLAPGIYFLKLQHVAGSVKLVKLK
jgi:hypothetical protein